MGAKQENGDNFMDEKVKKYLTGEAANLEGLQDRKLKGQLAVREELYGKSAKVAAMIEKWLLPGEGGYLEAEGIEKTWRIKQESIAREVDILSSRNQYDIVLPELGPYTLDFTPNGRYMAAAGRKGHLAIVDMKTLNLIKEIQPNSSEPCNLLDPSVFFSSARPTLLHSLALVLDNHAIPVASSWYPYIYNRDGTELHCLKEHGAVLRLQFLRNHFLLASINKFGLLHYQDVTVGEMVGNFRTGSGHTDVMQVNPFNGVVALGHSSGTVTMWKPTSAAPLVKMLCHPGPVLSLAFHPNGHLMATSGKEKKIKIWDLRKFEVIQTFPGHAKTLNFSQKGLLAAGTGSFVEILANFSGSHNYSRYMTHSIAKGYQIGKVLFRPYEDVLGIGHSMGWSSILIPGSGEPNFDSWVANPLKHLNRGERRKCTLCLTSFPLKQSCWTQLRLYSESSKKEREADKGGERS
ncbi:hypothetical protein CRYUN_Cryun14cG0153700 [Craigia yunnanensis]